MRLRTRTELNASGKRTVKNKIHTNNTDPLLRKIAIRWQFIIDVTAFGIWAIYLFKAKGCVIRTEKQ